jgi:hypothetical protein
MARLGVGNEDPHRRCTLCALMKGGGGLVEGTTVQRQGQQHGGSISGTSCKKTAHVLAESTGDGRRCNNCKITARMLANNACTWWGSLIASAPNQQGCLQAARLYQAHLVFHEPLPLLTPQRYWVQQRLVLPVYFADQWVRRWVLTECVSPRAWCRHHPPPCHFYWPMQLHLPVN